MICPKCQNKLSDDARYCNKCGNILVQGNSLDSNHSSSSSNDIDVVNKPENSKYTSVKYILLITGIIALFFGSFLLLGANQTASSYEPGAIYYVKAQALFLMISGVVYIVTFFLRDEIIVRLKNLILFLSIVNLIFLPFGTIISLPGFFAKRSISKKQS